MRNGFCPSTRDELASEGSLLAGASTSQSHGDGICSQQSKADRLNSASLEKGWFFGRFGGWFGGNPQGLQI